MLEAMLHIRDLIIEKAGKTICRVAELDVARGERVVLVGANGAGKTTLLRVLGGLERDVQGECRIEQPLRKRVYVHQAPYLFQGSVAWNVGYGLAAQGVKRKERVAIVRHWLDTFGVSQLAERRCAKLSGGERRRVALARAFAIRADLMLLDEPFADLDKNGIDIVRRAIDEAEDATIVIASPTPLPDSFPVRTYLLDPPSA